MAASPDTSDHSHLNQLLSALLLPPLTPRQEEQRAALELFVQGLPRPQNSHGPLNRDEIIACLSEREKRLKQRLGLEIAQGRSQLAQDNLSARHAFSVLHGHTRLMDRVVSAALWAALEELPWMVHLKRVEGEKELAFQAKLLPEKQARLENFLQQKPAILQLEGDSPQQRAYLEKIESGMRRELSQLEQSVQTLQEELPAIQKFKASPQFILKRLVLFARGGYGRGEMSLESDLDTGYCLDTQGLYTGEVRMIQEMVMRAESLLSVSGLVPASQYFELGEDLSRFTLPETVHAIPAILESRPILGPPQLLQKLQRQFRQILPFETLLNQKVSDFQSQKRPSYTAIDLKEDSGGLRTIQIPLWVMSISMKTEEFQMGQLIGQAVQKKLLSVWEAGALALALEFLYDLRNFVGAAESHYNDQEAQSNRLAAIPEAPGLFNDAMERLYLFKKGRFGSMDQLDTYRLRLSAEARRIGAALMGRVMDRVITHRFGHLQASIHLGRRLIIALHPADGRHPAHPADLLAHPKDMLALFGYIAQTGYDLTDGLKDGLAEVVTRVEGNGVEGAALHDFFSNIMQGPHPHRAFRTFFEINDPLSQGMETLLGRFIPSFNQAYYLLREINGRLYPVHQLMLDALENGQQRLEAARQSHPEWSGQLTHQKVLALKWALLLHPAGKIDKLGETASDNAKRAIEILETLGYPQGELLETVGMLVENQHLLVTLSKTATYFDQALSEFFEVAGREPANVVLLYLMNRAVHQTLGAPSEEDLPYLDQLFEEAARILTELRGVPQSGRSNEFINHYLTRKKDDLEADTRLFLLMGKTLAQGLDEALFNPLKAHSPKVFERLTPQLNAIRAQHRAILMEKGGRRAQEEKETRLVRMIGQHLNREAVNKLLKEDERLLSWFFSSLPNRYLLRFDGRFLAAQLVKFSGFQNEPVLVDLIAGRQGALEALIIHTRGLSRSHARVAYAIHLKHLNILHGKVNPVDFPDGETGFCYYFQVSPLAPTEGLHPRDFERLVMEEHPPDPQLSLKGPRPRAKGTRVDFLGNDGKGYRIQMKGGSYQRADTPLQVIRIQLKDSPFLFYKANHIFEQFGVQVNQSLITTTGSQVIDYFYLEKEDYDRLKGSSFEESFIELMASPAFNSSGQTAD